MKTIFQKIIDKEEPADFLFENDRYIIIKSKFPVAPVHNLVIPKKLIRSVDDATDSDTQIIGEMILLGSKFAKEQKIEGYRLIFNCGNLPHVPHIHLHIISGEIKDFKSL